MRISRAVVSGVLVVACCLLGGGVVGSPVAAQSARGGELIYSAEDLDPPPSVPEIADLDQAVKGLIEKALQRNPLLKTLLSLDLKETRGLQEKLLEFDKKWRVLDSRFRSDLTNLLSGKARFDFEAGLRLLRGVKGGAALQNRLERAFTGYRQLREMAVREGRRGEGGRFGFLAGRAKEVLARGLDGAGKPQRRELLLGARDEYRTAFADLSQEPDLTGAVTADDALEKVRVLEQEFGGIVPLTAKGRGVVRMTSDIGVRKHPIKKKLLHHKGIDFADSSCNGWPVCAFGPGKVTYSGWESGYGYVQVLAHELDGKPVFTRYAHLRKAGRLPAGRIVSRGDQIGLCNNTGGSKGSHLHFEVRAGDGFGQVLDPKTWLPAIERASTFKPPVAPAAPVPSVVPAKPEIVAEEVAEETAGEDEDQGENNE